MTDGITGLQQYVYLFQTKYRYMTFGSKHIMTQNNKRLHFFGGEGSFYNFPRVKQLSYTIFKSIQLICVWREHFSLA